MGFNRKLTDLPTKTLLPTNAWLHFVDPNDLNDSPEGSDFKITAANAGLIQYVPEAPYKLAVIYNSITNPTKQFVLTAGIRARMVIIEGGRFLHESSEWFQVGTVLTIIFELENGNKITILN